METDFVTNVKSMVEKLLSPDRFQVKKLGLSEMRSKDMSKYILECMECFENNKQFAPQAVQVVNQKFMINLEAEKAIEKYVQGMDKDEKRRHQMIVNERRYREQLAREKEEANAKLDKEKRENEKKQAEILAQKERERIQLEREHAAKMEMERIAHEKKQAELVRKQEEERKRLEAEMKSKLEAEKKESERREREIRAENERERRTLENSRSSSQMPDLLMAQLMHLQLSSAAANTNRYHPGYSNGYCNNGMYGSGLEYGNGYGNYNMYGGGSSSYGNSSRSRRGNPANASDVYYDEKVNRFRNSRGRFTENPNK
uniref:Uncharacterized protein n=1 Tax=Panagrolaimus davidi TaxID=227884 RepID=A0A914QTP2_9BILA